MQKRFLVSAVMTALTVLLVSGFVAAYPNSFGAVRSFSSTSYIPGSPLTVTIDINVGASTICTSTIEEYPPAGWIVTNINGPGGGDNSSGHIIWGIDGPHPSCGTTPANYTVSYNVTPPIGQSGAKTFSLNSYILVGDYVTLAMSTANISGSSSISNGVGAFCGDGNINPPEVCDGTNITATCASLGFPGGTIGCTGCQYDTSGCIQNGICGTSQNSCTGGDLSNPTQNSTSYLWNCNGRNGGTNTSCSSAIPTGGGTSPGFEVSALAMISAALFVVILSIGTGRLF